MAAKKTKQKKQSGSKVPNYDIRDFNNDFNRIDVVRKTQCNHQAYTEGLILGCTFGIVTTLTCFLLLDLIRQSKY